MLLKLITDSACDLPEHLIEKYNIDVLPLNIYCGEKQYMDKIGINSEDIYSRMKGGEMFRTSQITPIEFEKNLEKYALDNTSCLYLAFSGGLSGTYDSSVVAINILKEKYPQWQCEAFDTRCTCGGLGLIVLKAAEMIEHNCTKEQIYKMVEHYRNHMEHIFTVDDMNFLYKGGRVNKTTAVVGGMLNIKPILNLVDGKIYPLERVRGAKKVNSKIIEIIEDKADDLPSQTISIGYACETEKFEIIRDEIKSKIGYKEIIYTFLGATVAAHSGPGTIAIFFLNKKFEI